MMSSASITVQQTIDVGELRERLERHEPVTILDVRSREDRVEWAIPGSVHVDVYQALKTGDVHALDHLNLPPESEVVTVCGVGKAAAFAAERLRARGISARALAGGMKAWSLAWNVAEVRVPESTATVIQVRRTGKGCLSYLIGSGAEAVVIDASLNPDVYIDLAATQGWTITHVLDTHVHADHLSRGRALAEASGGVYYAPLMNRLAFAFEPMADRDYIAFGRSHLTTLATPGHTPESSSYLLDGRAILTGDTLFLSGVGRPDLEANTSEARERALLLWSSLQRLTALPPDTLVLPGHTSEPVPFDGTPIAASLSDVLQNVGALRLTAPDFVETILSRLPPTPPNHAAIVALNEAGRIPDGDPTDLEAGANRCAIS
jgi:glyoxylase-like metal-dependent hydrolase (beta-lactamase superfamily II)